MLAIGILFYTYDWSIFPGVKAMHRYYILSDWFIACGAATIMVMILSSNRLSGLMAIRFIAWLGKISYSLYLCHLVVLTAVIYTLHDFAPTWLIVLVAFASALGISAIYWRIVETPSIRFGRYVAGVLRPVKTKLEGQINDK
jgi:peptidoglycan/LPS O-acetylase OafA/YrhL